jgi:hypothetical protein
MMFTCVSYAIASSFGIPWIWSVYVTTASNFIIPTLAARMKGKLAL